MAEQIIEVPGQGRIAFPEGMSDADISAAIKRSFPDIAKSIPPAESAAMQKGRKMNSGMQGALSALQGPTFGFLDEAVGGLVAAGHAIGNLTPWGNKKSFTENYANIRDEVRGATAQNASDYPITSAVTRAMTAAPTMMFGASAAPVVATATGAGRALGQAAQVGAVQGGLSGAGESTRTGTEMLADALGGSAKGAAMGTAAQGAMSVIGAGASNIAQRVSNSSAGQVARERLAEAIARGARGTQFQPGAAGNPAAQTAARLRTLGPEASIADAGGVETRRLADTLATLPGTAKSAVEDLIHSRQATRGPRLVAAADEALGTQGRGFTATMQHLDDVQRQTAAPLYKQLENVSVRVDQELEGLLQRAGRAHKPYEELTRTQGGTPIDLSKLRAGDDVPFAALDKIKQELWTLAENAKTNTFKPTAQSVAFNDLRTELTKKLDALAPQNKGGSIYSQAREAYSGPAQLKSALDAGRAAMRDDAIGIADTMRGLSKSELEGFRIGALQALREKVGTESGQTSLTKMWKESATSDKLREIFGNDYRQFAAEVAKEARLKLFDQVGRGSQTASRLYGAGDLDGVASQGAQAVLGAATKNPLPGIRAASTIWNKVKTPEATRDELARLLLLRGPQAQQEMSRLPGVIQSINDERARRAALAGALGGFTQR